MTWSILLAFVVAAFLLAMVPGQGTAVFLRHAVRGGRRGALAALAGMELGVLCWAIAAALGLSVVLVTSPLAYQVLRFLGVGVLLWLGIKALLSARRAATAPPAAPSTGAGFRAGALVNLANPKIAVFAISFLPQFLPPEQASRPALLLLAVLWVVADTVWYLIVTVLLVRLLDWLRRAEVRRRLEQLSGGVLIALGIRLALESS